MEEGIKRTQQQSVPPQMPQVGRAGGDTGASPSIRWPMLEASVAEAKKPSRGILQWLAPSRERWFVVRGSSVGASSLNALAVGVLVPGRIRAGDHATDSTARH